MLDIDRTLCTGCGVCVDVCPTGAISLDEEDISRIDLALCNGCLVCLDACSNGAIKRVESSELTPVVEGEIVESGVTPTQIIRFPRTLGRSNQLAALTGTALSFVGSWLLPRATGALLGVIERRLAGRSALSPRSFLLRGNTEPLMRTGRDGTRSRSRQHHRRRRGW